MKKRVKRRPFVYFFPSLRVEEIKRLLFLSAFVICLSLSRLGAIVLPVSTAIAAIIAQSLLLIVQKDISFYKLVQAASEGLIAGLLLPVFFPLRTAFMITLSVFFITGYFFAYRTSSFISRAVLSCAFCYVIGHYHFDEAFKGASDFHIFFWEDAVRAFLNSRFFEIFNMTLKEGSLSFFVDNFSPVAAFRFTFISSLYILSFFFARDFREALLRLFFLAFFFLAAYFSFADKTQAIFFIFENGVVFAASFLFFSEAISPTTFVSKFIFAIFAAILLYIMTRYNKTASVIFTALIMNFVSIIFFYLERKIDLFRMKKAIRSKV